jgi:membrane-associated protease RseP (regulator of RpoE activity)
VAPPAGALPTQPVATPVAEPVTAVATTVPPSDGTIRVQRWVVYALAAFAVGAIGFALGWVAAPGGGDGGRSVSVQVPRDLQNMFGRNGPFGNGSGNNNGGNNGSNGNSGGSGNGNAAPRANGAFLGVVTSSSTNPQGAQIERVVSGSPASDANLEQGDVITKVDSTSVDGPAALASAIGGHQAGDTVTITYERNGSSATAKVKLQSRSSANLGAPQAPSSNF